MTPEQLHQLANLIAGAGGGNVGVGTRATPSTPSTPYYTGPGGLFGALGLERDVFSTRIQPRGLASRLPARGTVNNNPMFPYLTGFLGPSGSVAAGVCDDPETVGAGKSCIQTAQFGRYSYQTRTLEVNRLGALINRGEFTDLTLVNEPLLGDQGGILNPQVGGNFNVRNEINMRFLELGIQFQNTLGRQLYEGNPANNNAGGGYQEFPGLDILIGTNKVDALTGTPCPSLASDIKNFNYVNVTTTPAATAGIVNVLTYLMRTLRTNAENMNMDPVEWALVMRPGLFYELTAVWPCAYATYRCQTTGDNNQGVVDTMDMVRFRDEMRNGNYLIVDGIRFPVILDTFIREESNTTSNRVSNGCFASDIYVVPLTVRGNIAATYWEHFDYREGLFAQAGAAGMAGGILANYYWTEGGRYLWHFKPPNNWCAQWLAKIEPRVILRTPHLAGRLTNVQYCPLQHENDPLNTDPYFVNGGATSRTAPTFWTEWGQTI